MPNSNIATLDASNLSYEFEKARINGSTDDTIITDAQQDKTIPNNLEYLDDFYDKSTGTSGTAFKDKNTGQVIVGYTGTNFKTDFSNDVLGSDLAIALGKQGGHYPPAFDFYEKITEEYGDNVVLTGHSLGGNVAQRVALEYNAPTTVVYNAAPLYILQNTAELVKDWLNPADSDIERVEKLKKKYTGKTIRIRAEGDILNNAANLATGIYIGKDYVLKNAGTHGIDPEWTTKPKVLKKINSILDEEIYEGISLLERSNNSRELETRKVLNKLSDLKNKLIPSTKTSGALSSYHHEKIFLDSQQGLVVVKAMAETARAGSDAMKETRNQALEDSLAILEDRDFDSFKWLSYDEVEAIYAEHGVDEAKITALVSSNFDSSISQAETLAAEFETLLSEVQTGIQTMLEADAGLASDFDSWLDLAD